MTIIVNKRRRQKCCRHNGGGYLEGPSSKRKNPCYYQKEHRLYTKCIYFQHFPSYIELEKVGDIYSIFQV